MAKGSVRVVEEREIGDLNAGAELGAQVGADIVALTQAQRHVPEAPSAPKASASNALGNAAMLVSLGLRVLSERAVLAAYHVFPLLALAATLGVWLSVIEAPSTHQIVASALFAVFSLALVWLTRK